MPSTWNEEEGTRECPHCNLAVLIWIRRKLSPQYDPTTNEAPDEAFLRQLGFSQDGDDDSREFGLYLWGINDKETIEAGDNEPAMQIVVSLEDGSMWLEAYKHGESLAIIEIPRKSRAELIAIIRALGNEVKAPIETLADQINALPEPLRQFVHDLEANADPSGNIREANMAREGLMAAIRHDRGSAIRCLQPVRRMPQPDFHAVDETA